MRFPGLTALAGTMVALTLSVRVATASTMNVDSSAFLNGGVIPSFDSAATLGCHGSNVSPPLRITGVPSNAQSLAVVMVDADGNGGAGFVHWVAYGIAPRTGSLPSGFGTSAGPYVPGRNDAGTNRYFGPCPPPGDPPHHYTFSVYALALAPERLAPGLTRAALLRAAAGRTLAVGTITATYAR